MTRKLRRNRIRPVMALLLELEGGFFAIRGDDSVTYNPTNLPAEFQQDGLAVEADARRRDDMAGIHQVGPLIQLERIRRR